MRFILISFTEEGCILGQKVSEGMTELGFSVEPYTRSSYTQEMPIPQVTAPLEEWTKEAFAAADGLLFIGACGIAVRLIAPYIRDKKTDPAVMVMDEQGKFVISLLSGHLGGANELTELIAQTVGATPVITTATDVSGKFAVDVLARKNQCYISSMEEARRISAALLAGRPVGFSCDFPFDGMMPPELVSGMGLITDFNEDMPQQGIMVAAALRGRPYTHTLYLVPPVLTIGIGCRKDTFTEVIAEAVTQALESRKLFPEAVAQVCSIDQKSEEAGLLKFCQDRNLPFVTYSAEELEAVQGNFEDSDFVREQVGVGNVCERSAVLGSGGGKLLLEKQKGDGVTVAIAQKTDWRLHFE